MLEYRAGPAALRILRSHGLVQSVLGAVAAPASGPRWMAMVGLDRALMESGLLQGDGRRTLLVGASAGAWRMLALACRDPETTHRRLAEGYLGQVFGRRDTPRTVSHAYREMLSGIVSPADAAHAVDHPRLDLGMNVTRVRGPLAAQARWLQAAGMAVAGALRMASVHLSRLAYERVLLHSRPGAFVPEIRGRVVPLTTDNLLAGALASGTVPLYMEPVPGVDGERRGAFIDGGVGDYHLNQAYASDEGTLTLFLHFQREVLPEWFDRYRRSRRPAAEVTERVLQVYPSPAYVASLPGGRLPDRSDFLDLMDEPDERMRRWREAVTASELLGSQLLDDLGAGRIPDLAQPM